MMHGQEDNIFQEEILPVTQAADWINTLTLVCPNDHSSAHRLVATASNIILPLTELSWLKPS